MASLSTCHLEIVVWDGNLVKSCQIKEHISSPSNSSECDRNELSMLSLSGLSMLSGLGDVVAVCKRR